MAGVGIAEIAGIARHRRERKKQTLSLMTLIELINTDLQTNLPRIDADDRGSDLG
jgi:hypothetical protein